MSTYVLQEVRPVLPRVWYFNGVVANTAPVTRTTFTADPVESESMRRIVLTHSLTNARARVGDMCAIVYRPKRAIPESGWAGL